MSTNTGTLIASITSDGQPQEGQKHRSSGNFSLEGAPSGTRQIQFIITGNDQADKILFDVMKDVSAGHDPTIWSNLANNFVRDYEASRSFYIANPQNTGGKSFIVSVYVFN